MKDLWKILRRGSSTKDNHIAAFVSNKKSTGLTVTIDCIPTEVLLQICGHLSTKDLQQLALVCRSLRALARHPSLTKELPKCLYTYGNALNRCKVGALIEVLKEPRVAHIKRFSVPVMFDAGPKAFQLIADHLPSVTHVELGDTMTGQLALQNLTKMPLREITSVAAVEDEESIYAVAHVSVHGESIVLSPRLQVEDFFPYRYTLRVLNVALCPIQRVLDVCHMLTDLSLSAETSSIDSPLVSSSLQRLKVAKICYGASILGCTKLLSLEVLYLDVYIEHPTLRRLSMIGYEVFVSQSSTCIHTHLMYEDVFESGLFYTVLRNSRSHCCWRLQNYRETSRFIFVLLPQNLPKLEVLHCPEYTPPFYMDDVHNSHITSPLRRLTILQAYHLWRFPNVHTLAVRSFASGMVSHMQATHQIDTFEYTGTDLHAFVVELKRSGIKHLVLAEVVKLSDVLKIVTRNPSLLTVRFRRCHQKAKAWAKFQSLWNKKVLLLLHDDHNMPLRVKSKFAGGLMLV